MSPAPRWYGAHHVHLKSEFYRMSIALFTAYAAIMRGDVSSWLCCQCQALVSGFPVGAIARDAVTLLIGNPVIRLTCYPVDSKSVYLGCGNPETRYCREGCCLVIVRQRAGSTFREAFDSRVSKTNPRGACCTSGEVEVELQRCG